MELRHLRYFLVVAELLNFTRAAKKLRLAQPALSRQIRDLENDLGVKLFERNSRVVFLTDAGKHFINEARTVICQAEEAVKSVQAFAKGDRGKIEIGFAPSLTVELLPKAMKAFEHDRLGVQVNLHDLSIQEMLFGLKERRLHLAFTPEPPNHDKDIKFEPLRAYPICVALNPGHRLARLKALTIKSIERERILVYARADYPEYNEWVESIISKDIKAAFAAAEEHDSGPSLIAGIESGRGIAIVPSIIASAAGPRIKCRRLEPSPAPMVIGIAYSATSISPAAERFIKLAMSILR